MQGIDASPNTFNSTYTNSECLFFEMKKYLR